ncbi:MAG TPA: TetR/AcrR family transcriptional regulator [Kofleriaceae bacterium]|nr:TetR/AcrR family transcriptional regulator [Kofleriaceae bacterium]
MPTAAASTATRAKARKAASRKQPQQARSRAMVDAILDAAARVLRKHGYEEATTNRVAEVAGVSVGSLYQYFPNKEALVHALIERHDGAMWAVFTDHATAAIGRPFAEAVPAVIDALFACHHVDPDLHRVLHQQLPRLGALALVQATTIRYRALVEDLLRARPDQHGRADDVATTALVITEAIEALIHASIDLPPARAKAVQRHASELVLRYLGVPA